MRRACAVLGVCVNAAGSVLVRANLRAASMSVNLHQQLCVCYKKLRAKTLHAPQPHAARRPARSYTSANRAQNVQYASAALQPASSLMLSHLILLRCFVDQRAREVPPAHARKGGGGIRANQSRLWRQNRRRKATLQIRTRLMMRAQLSASRWKMSALTRNNLAHSCPQTCRSATPSPGSYAPAPKV